MRHVYAYFLETRPLKKLRIRPPAVYPQVIYIYVYIDTKTLPK